MIRNLEVIGQAVRDLGPEELANRVPHVPWQQIAGLRNVLARQYLGVDLRLVRTVVDKDLPLLCAAIEAMLADGKSAR